MATRASIEFDFNQAIRQAKRLEEVAESLSRMSSTNMNNTLQGVSVNWKGENATNFVNKGENLKGKVSDSAAELRTIANNIRTIARKVYKAEMDALLIAESRSY